jgi:hypothetical protein
MEFGRARELLQSSEDWTMNTLGYVWVSKNIVRQPHQISPCKMALMVPPLKVLPDVFVGDLQLFLLHAANR